MTVLLDKVLKGVKSPVLRIERLADCQVVGSGTNGDTIEVWVSGSCKQDDFLKFGTITISSGVGLLQKETGTDIEMNPFARLYAIAGANNTGSVSAYLQTER